MDLTAILVRMLLHLGFLTHICWWVVKSLVLPVWAVGHVVGSVRDTPHIKVRAPRFKKCPDGCFWSFGAKMSSFQKLSNLGADLDQCVRSMKDPTYVQYILLRSRSLKDIKFNIHIALISVSHVCHPCVLFRTNLIPEIAFQLKHNQGI